jgi:predicted acyltransferase (DUF342 family)
MWCEIDGNVLVGDDAYLGERVHITGQLIVSGDLDIGDDVEIERGFEANGWIVIRNPMPTIVFLFVYLSHLLRVGEKEAAAEVADEFLAEERDADPVVIPRSAHVSDDTWRVSTPATIGEACRLHGNIRATEIDVGADTEVFGSLRAKGSIRVGSGAVVHGDVTTRGGDVTIAPGAYVRGGISCERCELSEAAEVEGTIRARDGITLEDAPAATDDAGSADPDDEPSEAVSADADLTPAIVPIEAGTLSKSSLDSESETGTETASTEGSSRAFVPLDEDDPEPTQSIVPVEEGEFDWESIGATGANHNGAGEGAALITDAEER